VTRWVAVEAGRWGKGLPGICFRCFDNHGAARPLPAGGVRPVLGVRTGPKAGFPGTSWAVRDL